MSVCSDKQVKGTCWTCCGFYACELMFVSVCEKVCLDMSLGLFGRSDKLRHFEWYEGCKQWTTTKPVESLKLACGGRFDGSCSGRDC